MPDWAEIRKNWGGEPSSEFSNWDLCDWKTRITQYPKDYTFKQIAYEEASMRAYLTRPDLPLNPEEWDDIVYEAIQMYNKVISYLRVGYESEEI